MDAAPAASLQRDADGMPERSQALRTDVDEHKKGTLNKDERFRSVSPPNQQELKEGKVLVDSD